MIEVLRRWGPQFLTAFIALVISIVTVSILAEGDYVITVVRFLAALAIICFAILITALIYDIRDGRRKDREAKATRDYEALKKSFRRAHPEWTDEQLEIATIGRPYTPPIEGEEEWMSPMEAYKKSMAKKEVAKRKITKNQFLTVLKRAVKKQSGSASTESSKSHPSDDYSGKHTHQDKTGDT